MVALSSNNSRTNNNNNKNSGVVGGEGTITNGVVPPLQQPSTTITTTTQFQLTTDIVQHRLHTGLGISGGSRGSLTKCASLLSNYVQNYASMSSSTRSGNQTKKNGGTSTISI